MLKWFSKKIHNRKGFTLVELVVVIAILGILASIAVPRFTNSTAKAEAAAMAANIRTLNAAVSMYLVQEGKDISDFSAVTDAAGAITILEEAGVLTPGTVTTGISFDNTDAVFSETK